MSKEKKGLSRKETILAYKEVYATEAGQAMLADLMHYFSFSRRTLFVSGDQGHTDWHEGQRSVIVHIGNRIEADPDEADDLGKAEGL